MTLTRSVQPFNLPNLRRLFVEARTEAEENAYSRRAVRAFRRIESSSDIGSVLQSRHLHVRGRHIQPDRSENDRQELVRGCT